MRHSLFPIICALVILITGLLLIRPTIDRGQGGPVVAPGPFMLPKPTRWHPDPVRTASMALVGSTVARLDLGSRDEGGWRVVVITGSDDQPMTRAVMRAFGEALYAAGCVAVMDPVLPADTPAPPLALPADRVLRITTRTAPLAVDPHAPWTAAVEFRLWEPRLPPDHPAAGLLPPPAIMPIVCVVAHQGRPADGAAGSWPERWAATGREVAKAALATLMPPGGVQAPAGAVSSSWDQALPPPPGTDELHWDACFQHEFVRGWSGRIVGRSVISREGGSEPSEAPLLRLLVSGKWTTEAPTADWRLWSRTRDGRQEWFSLRQAGSGWETAMWCERSPAALIDAWIAAAKSGDAAAREHLRRALAVRDLRADLRQRVEAAVR